MIAGSSSMEVRNNSKHCEFAIFSPMLWQKPWAQRSTEDPLSQTQGQSNQRPEFTSAKILGLLVPKAEGMPAVQLLHPSGRAERHHPSSFSKPAPMAVPSYSGCTQGTGLKLSQNTFPIEISLPLLGTTDLKREYQWGERFKGFRLIVWIAPVTAAALQEWEHPDWSAVANRNGTKQR